MTYTLATDDDGLPSDGLFQVQALRNADVTLDVLSLMTMDMGTFAQNPNSRLDSSLSAIKAGAKQLEHIYNLPAGSGMSRMGVIPMPGKDDQDRTFHLADATRLAQFAKAQGMAYVSYWAFTRDLPGNDKDVTVGIPGVTAYSFFNSFSGSLKNLFQ